MLHISTQDGYGTREIVTAARHRAAARATATWSSLNRRIAEHGRADVRPR